MIFMKGGFFEEFKIWKEWCRIILIAIIHSFIKIVIKMRWCSGFFHEKVRLGFLLVVQVFLIWWWSVLQWDWESAALICLSCLSNNKNKRNILQSPAVDVVGIGTASGRIIIHNIRLDETLMSFTQDWGPISSLAFRTGEGLSLPLFPSFPMRSHSL